MFKKILIANRGEIACRIIKTAKRLGIKTVAICSDPDENAPHVNLADEYINIGGQSSAESYLIIPKIIDALKSSKADAVHPGYGFLSENVQFRDEIHKSGKIFIGPPSQAISLMGDKIESKKLAKNAGVSIVPGGLSTIKSLDKAILEAKKIGYPLMVKASAGGGGKGMRIAFNEKELKENFNSAINEAKSRGIEKDRLVFSKRTTHENYLAQLKHADVYLDTFVYNAGATASNALFVGVPVITKIGKSYTARMASSLLRSIDLSELITTSSEDYEKLAFELSTNPEKLKKIKNKLAINFIKKPLFNTEMFTLYFENGLEQIFNNYIKGKDPQNIYVNEN